MSIRVDQIMSSEIFISIPKQSAYPLIVNQMISIQRRLNELKPNEVEKDAICKTIQESYDSRNESWLAPAFAATRHFFSLGLHVDDLRNLSGLPRFLSKFVFESFIGNVPDQFFISHFNPHIKNFTISGGVVSLNSGDRANLFAGAELGMIRMERGVAFIELTNMLEELTRLAELLEVLPISASIQLSEEQTTLLMSDLSQWVHS
jgi:hypothetical protein